MGMEWENRVRSRLFFTESIMKAELFRAEGVFGGRVRLRLRDVLGWNGGGGATGDVEL